MAQSMAEIAYGSRISEASGLVSSNPLFVQRTCGRIDSLSSFQLSKFIEISSREVLVTYLSRYLDAFLEAGTRCCLVTERIEYSAHVAESAGNASSVCHIAI